MSYLAHQHPRGYESMVMNKNWRRCSFLLALILASSLLACSKESKDESRPAEPQRAAPAEQPAASVEPPSPAPSEPGQAEPSKPPEPEPSPPEPVKPAERMTAPVAPAGGWTVQIGSYAHGSNASNLVKKLRDKGYQAYAVEAVAGGRTVHRVHVGRFATKQEALALAKTVESKEGFSGAFVVRQSGGTTGPKMPPAR
jgi:cell division septation protein DedD